MKTKPGGKSSTIKRKIIIGLGLMLLVSNFLMLIVNRGLMKRYFTAQIEEDMEAVARASFQIIDAQLRGVETLIEELSNSPVLTDERYLWSERVNYFEERAKKLNFKVFFYVDTKGFGKNLTQAGQTFDVSERNYFKESITGKVHTSEIQNDKMDGSKVFFISAPVYRNGSVQGVFVGIKEASFISEMCANFEWKNSGTLSVYDRDSNVLGHTDQEIVNSGLNVLEAGKSDVAYQEMAAFFKEEIAQKEIGGRSYEVKGDSVFSTFYRSKERGMTILLTIGNKELYYPLRRLSQKLMYPLMTFLILTLVSSYYGANLISKGFNNLKKDIEHLADYDLIAEPTKDYSGRTDEVGAIYRAVIKLKENLRDIVQSMHAASGELTNSAEIFAEKCREAGNVSSDIAKSVDDIAQVTANQASDTQEGVHQTRLMQELLDENNRNLDTLNRESENTEKLKDQGLRTMNELLEATEKNQAIALEIRDAISHTQASVENIKSAGEMIQVIADQTNLLALNAAIEAARAGDAGRGFAVVAEEIRKLAENSGSFTEQINDSVTDLLNRTSIAVEKMSEASEIVEAQSAKVGEAELGFRGITDAVNSLRQSIDALVSANEKIDDCQTRLYGVMENASALSEENSASTEEISASTQEQAATFEEIAEESHALTELAADLVEKIEKFRY